MVTPSLEDKVILILAEVSCETKDLTDSLEEIKALFKQEISNAFIAGNTANWTMDEYLKQRGYGNGTE